MSCSAPARGSRAIPAIPVLAVLAVLTVPHLSAHAIPAGIPVVVAPVEKADMAASQPFVGTVYPARVSDVGSAVDGRVVDPLPKS